MKPVVILGKGRSAHYVPPSDEYDVAAVSEAVRLSDRCDFLGINDLAALQAMRHTDYQVVRSAVLPTWLHADPGGNSLAPLEFVEHEIPVPVIHRISLETAPRVLEGALKVGKCWSTAESLVAFLLDRGYRDFLMCGVGRDERYHPLFKPRTVKGKSHFLINHRRLAQRIKNAGGTMGDFA